MNIIAPKPPVKLEPVSRPDCQGVDHPRRQSNFACGIAASEFGGRYFGWREWGDFTDIHPKALAAKRRRALWREDPS